jgi:hypothetical protein
MTESAERDPDYHAALGRFIEQYAEAEFAMASLLWGVAKVSAPIARAIFSGVRSEGASQFIVRIFDVIDAPKEHKEEFKFITAKLKLIRDARNLVIHDETRRGRDGIPYLVTNRRVALDKERLRERPMSAAILQQMTDDLEKIVGHLLLLLAQSKNAPKAEIEFIKDVYATELDAPWQYKPPLIQQPKSTRRKPQGRKKRQVPIDPR